MTSEQYEFLQLARVDMEEVIELSKILAMIQQKLIDWDEERVHQLKKGLETGIIVSYARPFTKTEGKGFRPLGDESTRHLSREELTFHEKVLKLRKQRYAHTDGPDSTNRRAWTQNSTNFESFRPLTHDEVAMCRSIAEKNQKEWDSKIRSLIELMHKDSD